MTTYRISTTVNVTNEEHLLAYANERTQECWGSGLEDMVTDGEEPVERALIEAILFSSENPSPDEYGIEFLDAEVQEL